MSRAPRVRAGTWGRELVARDVGRSGYADLSIGLPEGCNSGVSEAQGPGSVIVIFGSRDGLGPQRIEHWDQDSPDVPEENESDGTFTDDCFFGFALASADLVGGQRADLVVGQPSESVEFPGPVVVDGSGCGHNPGGNDERPAGPARPAGDPGPTECHGHRRP